eukprot:TRINITY_DN7757_c0_g1_i1.p1 TRINITY_DN7757_c0_g1~~TRINITY_DN7757_c0_g1_i1.p1  ORF type:complete len:693 (+),score=115.76 TRINITY_DN7757_c0_g1_i1:51-2081(+)
MKRTIDATNSTPSSRESLSKSQDSDNHFNVDLQYPAPPMKESVIPLIKGGKPEYDEMYRESIENPTAFWDKHAKQLISWFQPYTKVQDGSFAEGDVSWFQQGKLNMSYNCIDRHLEENADKVAILFEGDEVGTGRSITYRELSQEVGRLANALKRAGVRKGDAVCIYLPMIPEAAFAMLACTRIGAPHSVVFAGFSSQALASRILDAKCKVVITADEGRRGGRVVPLKPAVDEALLTTPSVETVFVQKHTGGDVAMKSGRDVWLADAMAAERPYCPPEWLDSEDVLFLLYTSGSTGTPKGVVHTQAGYLLYAMMTHKYVFDIHPGDVYACVADVGWITGHSYIVYGPLANGATTLMFESTPLYPDTGRYWEMIQRHKITQFYTAPTAIRALQKCGDEPVLKYDLSSLRVLGSVGEPINPTAWEWYYRVVGKEKCAVVDTYWQTENGGIIMTPLPGVTPVKPGSCTLPFFGIKPVLLNETTGALLTQNDVKGVLCVASPWPSVTRTVYGNHERYMNTYLRPYPNHYFTGDAAYRDKDGYMWIVGRVDDVLNVAGHRLGTAEIEKAFVTHASCAEAAVIGIPDDIKGMAIFAYCVLKHGYEPTADLLAELRSVIRSEIGPIATPKRIVAVAGLPKTRSGKIMRRILRKIATNESDSLGDLSTIADPDIVPQLIEAVKT